MTKLRGAADGNDLCYLIILLSSEMPWLDTHNNNIKRPAAECRRVIEVDGISKRYIKVCHVITKWLLKSEEAVWAVWLRCC